MLNPDLNTLRALTLEVFDGSRPVIATKMTDGRTFIVGANPGQDLQAALRDRLSSSYGPAAHRVFAGEAPHSPVKTYVLERHPVEGQPGGEVKIHGDWPHRSIDAV